MNTTPRPEFLEACRRVLGDDNRAVVLGAMMQDDPRMDEVNAIHADLVISKETEKPCDYHVEAWKAPKLAGLRWKK